MCMILINLVNWCILFVINFRKYRALVDNDTKSRRYQRERTHSAEICEWFKNEVGKNENISRELVALAKGPNRAANGYSGYKVNGYRFHTKQRDHKCTTQNSGICLTALTTSFTNSKDQNLIIGDVNYYGLIEEIIEVDYWGAFVIVLFRCTWYHDEKDSLGFTRVNFNIICQKSDPFVMFTQVQQVFYIEDPIESHFQYPLKRQSIDFYDTQDDNNTAVDDINGQFSHDLSFRSLLKNEYEELSWFRDDLPTKQIPVPSKSLN